MRVEYDLGLRVDDTEFRLARNDDVDRLAGGILALDGAQLVDLQTAFVFRNDIGLDRRASGHTTDVERTEGKLRTRLADRLRRDDTHDLALLHHACGGKVAAVALRAYAPRASQVSTERISTDSSGDFSIASAIASVISSPALQMTSPVSGWITSFRATRPRIRS